VKVDDNESTIKCTCDAGHSSNMLRLVYS